MAEFLSRDKISLNTGGARSATRTYGDSEEGGLTEGVYLQFSFWGIICDRACGTDAARAARWIFDHAC